MCAVSAPRLRGRRMPRLTKTVLMATASIIVVPPANGWAQLLLPPVEVVRPQPRRPVAAKPAVRRPTRVTTAARSRPTRVGTRAAAVAPALAAPAAEGPSPSGSALLAPSAAEVAQTAAFDQRRADLDPRTGANAYDLGRAAIESLPQGDNAPFDKVILQLPGVTQDSAGSGDFHIRNEHANVQYRINNIFLPEGHFRLQPDPRCEFRRQPGASRRRPARAIRSAHRRHCRHYHAQRRLRQRRLRQSSMAAATARRRRR